MCNIEAMIKEAIEMDAGSTKIIIRRKSDDFPLRIIAVYFESDELDMFLEDLEQLEATYGFGV
jgi:hypothetical protein